MQCRLVACVVTLFFMMGCAPKHYEKKQSSFITIKTEKLKYSDMGFIQNNNNSLKAQIYKFANPVLELKMHTNICVNSLCYRYPQFNKQYLHAKYPKYLIRNIFTAQKIFDGQNLAVTQEGFKQVIENSNYNISYEVKKDLIRFQDYKNDILIKIKKLEGN